MSEEVANSTVTDKDIDTTVTEKEVDENRTMHSKLEKDNDRDINGNRVDESNCVPSNGDVVSNGHADDVPDDEKTLPETHSTSTIIMGTDEQDSKGSASISNDMYDQLMRERDKLVKEVQSLMEKERINQEITRQLKEKCFLQQEKLDSEIEKEREAHAQCQNELNKKIQELSECHDSQEAVMSRVIVLDTEKVKLLDEQVILERKTRELTKENDRLQSLVKLQKAEITKLTTTNEKTDSKLTDQSSDIKKLNEELSSVNIKLKWAQNKLKSETEGHKTAKTELASTTKKLKLAKEETEQIRRDMKKMIGEYQNSEEMKSNTLDSKLKKKEEELKLQEQEIADQTQLHDLTVKELQLKKEALEISQKECSGLKTRVSELTNQITEKQLELDELKVTLNKEKKEQKRLQSEIESMKEMNADIDKEREAFAVLKEGNTHLQKSYQHLEREMSRRKEKEAELLGFSEKLSSSNAQLTADKGVLEGQIESLKVELERMTKELNSVRKIKGEIELNLSELQTSSDREKRVAMEQLHSKSLAVEQLTLSLEEEREQIAALKRKHANNIKDMQRQIQLYTKRIEQLESSHMSGIPTLPVDTNSHDLGMRTMSHGSLDGSPGNLHVSTYPNNYRMSSPDESTSPTLRVQNTMFETLDHEKTVLVEKICQLKRTLARREEKIEFLENHTTQLTDDLKKKSRIIQMYVVRDESGVLAPPEMDAHKERFRRKSGIMASVFSGSVHKGSPEVTLEMSLEITRKMQAVLEDTLIKNITLKENLDTLGQEIHRLTSKLSSCKNNSPSPRPSKR